jgi:hypothetical protein
MLQSRILDEYKKIEFEAEGAEMEIGGEVPPQEESD